MVLPFRHLNMHCPLDCAMFVEGRAVHSIPVATNWGGGNNQAGPGVLAAKVAWAKISPLCALAPGVSADAFI